MTLVLQPNRQHLQMSWTDADMSHDPFKIGATVRRRRLKPTVLIANCLFAMLLLWCDLSWAEQFLGEVQVAYAQSRNKEEQSSLIETTAYLEALISDNLSGFVVGYYDDTFRSTTLGMAMRFGSLQVGLGIGNATFNQSNHFVINPLAYYLDDTYTVYLHAEHYSNERDEPWYVRGYALRNFGLLSVGAYGDSFFGIGPRVDAKIGKHFSVWTAYSVALQPEKSAMRSMFGVWVGF